MTWNTACPDWEDRLLAGRSLVPGLPLFEDSAKKALRVFRRLRVPDIIGAPTMADACGPWFFPIVAALFGAYDPERDVRCLQEFFLLVPKGNAKSSYGGAVMLAAVIVNRRPEAEFLFVAPTIEIAQIAFRQAKGTIRLDPELTKLFQIQDHVRKITHRRSGATLQIKAADTEVITGSKALGTMIDETHVFAKKSNAKEIFVELRGALTKRQDGFLFQTTTQSKQAPSGVFAAELEMARKVRDGKISMPLLPVLYELPPQLSKEWKRRDLWPLVNPNLGRSTSGEFLEREVARAEMEGAPSLALIASQHFNVQIGIGLMSDGWPGAEFWLGAEDASITLEGLLDRCEVIVVGVDGGGLDDLFGFCALGRDKETKNWLSWSHAWCHKGVLSRRKTIAPLLEDFAADGDLTIVSDKLDDLTEIVALIDRINQAGLLACVAIDSEGPFGEFVDALAQVGITEDGKQVVGIGQGYKLMNAIKTTERKLVNGTLLHAPGRLMNWCVKNVKIEPTATAIRATKQNAGDAKIDPWCALMDAATVMITDPQPSTARQLRHAILERGGFA